MIFVDTSAWYALMDAEDPHHREARSFHADLGRGRFGRLVTSDYVLDEAYTLLRLRASLDYVRRLDHLLGRSRSLVQLWIGEEDFRRALQLMLEREDKVWSFTDCTSFVVMESMGVRDAFTFDSNYREAGFTLHP
ncbi:MAG: hypothetical protein A3K65_09635 [Euryarchaeota archaeon RBG_16_68_12]|nr:MAG: hypothetical protein A3K65_09635 [Euryarchaeota archaeon RBG_16_68_12]